MTLIFNDKGLIFSLGDNSEIAEVTYTRDGSIVHVSRAFAIGIVLLALQRLQNLPPEPDYESIGNLKETNSTITS